jgi:hypothetical protein
LSNCLVALASIPEPGSITLIVSGTVARLIWWRCGRHRGAASLSYLP